MIGLIGLNHTTAPLEIREECSLAELEAVQFIRNLEEKLPIEEAVVLSTCNRTELYFQSSGSCRDMLFDQILEELKSLKNIRHNIRDHFYSYHDAHAVRHLLSVAAGLNSMVLGENQILGQVKDAFRISSTRGLTGPILTRLFHKAFEAGKRVRSETAVNEGASSISYAAVELGIKTFGNICDSQILLIGAGETVELVLQSLVERGCSSVLVSNRTFSRAQELANKYCAEPCEYEQLDKYIEQCDIVLVSTASRVPILTKHRIQNIIKRERSNSIFIIDLSVPRNVERGVKDIENVFLYNIDDLKEIVAHNYEKRRNEIERSKNIIQEIENDYFAWIKTLNLSPTIENLKNKFDSLYMKELGALKKKLPKNEYERVAEFSHFLRGKYLGLVIKNLKSLSKKGQKVEYIDFINDLFDLKNNYADE